MQPRSRNDAPVKVTGASVHAAERTFFGVSGVCAQPHKAAGETSKENTKKPGTTTSDRCMVLGFSRIPKDKALDATKLNICTIKQGAERWLVTRQTIYRLIEDGTLTAYKSPAGRLIRIDIAELDAAFGKKAADA